MSAIEIATFRVREDSVGALISRRGQMIRALQSVHPALERAYLTRGDDGSFTDVIVWASREAAVAAAAHADEISECREWFSLIAESGGIRHVHVVDTYVAS